MVQPTGYWVILMTSAPVALPRCVKRDLLVDVPQRLDGGSEDLTDILMQLKGCSGGMPWLVWASNPWSAGTCLHALIECHADE